MAKTTKTNEEATKVTAKKSAAADNEAKSPAKKSTAKKAVNTASASATPNANAPSVQENITAQADAASPEAAATQASDAAEASTLDGFALPASKGKAGVLGGSKDRGIKPDDKLALPVGRHFTFERVRSLNPKSFYCAMRWEYHLHGKSPEESKRWWANKKLQITNPANGHQVVVRAVDFGPHENTGLTISLSPGALEALGLEIGGEVEIAFADQKTPLGVTNQ
ncbi:MAG: hypothetical protein HY231_19730 [Acidobacteria bacterium]|nr:hypothetical protein [Acidobacteriota bacterium]